MNSESITRPTETEYTQYYKRYIALVPGDNLLTYLRNQTDGLAALLEELPEEKLLYRYAPEKWSIKDIAQHLIDSERIFAYRVLTIARNDRLQLPGFEENDYAIQAHADKRSAQAMAHEFRTLRTATISLFESLDPEMLSRTGTANKQTVTPRALGYIIPGHEVHHVGVIKERYL